MELSKDDGAAGCSVVLLGVIAFFVVMKGCESTPSAPSVSVPRTDYQVSATTDGFVTARAGQYGEVTEIRRYRWVYGSDGKLKADLVFAENLREIEAKSRDSYERLHPDVKEERLKQEAEEKAKKLQLEADEKERKLGEESEKKATASDKIDVAVLKQTFKPGNDYQNALTFVANYKGTLGELLWCTGAGNSGPVAEAYSAAIPASNYAGVVRDARSAIVDTFGGVLQVAGAGDTRKPSVLTSPPYEQLNVGAVRNVIEGSKDIHDDDPVVQQQKALKLLWEKLANKSLDSEGWHFLTQTGILPRQALTELRSVVSPAAQADLDNILGR